MSFVFKNNFIKLKSLPVPATLKYSLNDYSKKSEKNPSENGENIGGNPRSFCRYCFPRVPIQNCRNYCSRLLRDEQHRSMTSLCTNVEGTTELILNTVQQIIFAQVVHDDVIDRRCSLRRKRLQQFLHF